METRQRPHSPGKIRRANAIYLRSGNSFTLVTDSAAIDRLHDVYAGAHWENHWDTLPADVSHRTTTLYAEGQELRRLS